MSNPELINELFVLRMTYEEELLNEKDIIIEMKYYLTTKNMNLEEINSLIYQFYSNNGIPISQEEINSIHINPPINILQYVHPQSNYIYVNNIESLLNSINSSQPSNNQNQTSNNEDEENEENEDEENEENEDEENEDEENEDEENEDEDEENEDEDEENEDEDEDEENEDEDEDTDNYNEGEEEDEEDEETINNPVLNNYNGLVINQMLQILGISSHNVLQNTNSIPEMEDVVVTLDDKDLDKIKPYILEEDSDEICSITLTPLNKGVSVIKLPCSHIFETEAIKEYLNKYNYKCPVCKHEVGKSHANI